MSDDNTLQTIEKIRAAVQYQRDRAFEIAVQFKIKWSERGAKSGRLSRFLFSMPHKVYSREEAISILKSDGKRLVGDIFDKSSYERCQGYYQDVLDLCTSLESARKYGVKEYKMTTAEMLLFNEWAQMPVQK